MEQLGTGILSLLFSIIVLYLAIVAILRFVTTVVGAVVAHLSERKQRRLLQIKTMDSICVNGRIADAEIVTLHLPEGTQYHHKYAFLYEDDNHVTRRAFLGISATTTLPYQIGETVPLRVFRQPVVRPEADAFDPARGADGRLPGLIAFRRWLGRPVDETGTVMREEDFVPLSRELDELRELDRKRVWFWGIAGAVILLILILFFRSTLASIWNNVASS